MSRPNLAATRQFTIAEIARLFKIPLRLVLGDVPFKKNKRTYGRGS